MPGSRRVLRDLRNVGRSTDRWTRLDCGKCMDDQAWTKLVSPTFLNQRPRADFFSNLGQINNVGFSEHLTSSET